MKGGIVALGQRAETIMWDRLFQLSGRSEAPLQLQIRRAMVAAILGGQLDAEAPLPSSRELARYLSVSRNTVVLAYRQLIEEGFLLANERRGYFVNGEALGSQASVRVAPCAAAQTQPCWPERFVVSPSSQRNIWKPDNWHQAAYPFVYGQPDPALFPIGKWRECSRQALGLLEVRNWSSDMIDADDPFLVQQLRTRVLPGRGIWADRDEVLVTVGAQQALFILSDLLASPGKVIGFENPGYPDARNIFSLRGTGLRALAVDEGGLVPDGALKGCDYVYVTPSHQCPTNVTMSMERRHELLRLAQLHDFVLIEDDYDSETRFSGPAIPTLKSLDRWDRVIYVGSLSKTLAPGLRVGYIVGPRELVREARALRRLMVRHPAGNNQRALALFLALGHHDALLRRLTTVLRGRSAALIAALKQHLPELSYTPTSGGSSLWVRAPDWLDTRRMSERASKAGILLEPGDIFFMPDEPPRTFFRLGFSSIPADRIDAGICALAGVIQTCRAED